MLQGGIPMPPPAMYPSYPPPHHHSEKYAPPIAPMPAQGMPPEMIPQSPDYPPPDMIQSPDYPPPDMIQSPDYPPDNHDGIQPTNYPAPLIHNQAMSMNQNGLMIPVPERAYYSRYGGMVSLDDPAGMQFRPEYTPQVSAVDSEPAIAPMPNIFVPVQHEPQRNISPYSFDDFPNELIPDYRPVQYVQGPRERRSDAPWASPTDVFAFDGMRNALPHCSGNPDDMFNVTGDRRAVGVDRLGAPAAPDANHADDQELEEELQALERRIDTEFKSAD
ncbi:hypothetical protein ABMA28_000072 [Loxostege sticticalis]|uniref:Uncharacterized protein n=1 Tax=Loxostege sticticalis TaxID=481309 RepID=A0ABD0TQY2_LOXSC